jgi:chorismate mutase-like protein
MPEQTSLATLRARIDALDEQIQHLLTERARCVLEVAEVKQAAGGKVEFYRPEREAQILRRVRERNQGPLSDAALVHLFREVISACMALERAMTIAVAKHEYGCASAAAAYRHFGHAVRIEPLPDLAAVVQAVAAEEADFGVLAQTPSPGALLEKLLETELLICGEVQLADLFMVIGKQRIAPSGQDRTALLALAAPQTQARLLEPFQRCAVAIVRTATWRYRAQQDAFLIVIAGHRDDPEVAQALAELAQMTMLCKILGSYPVEVP